MNLLMKKLVVMKLAVVGLLVSLHLQAQAVFDIQLAGRNIGNLHVSSAVTKNEVTVQRIEAEFSVPLYTGKFSNESHFQKGVLVHSTSLNYGNEQLKEKTVTRLVEEKRYEAIFSRENSKNRSAVSLVGDIALTVTSLYYGEPIGHKHVYSERFAKLCTLKRVAAGSYELLFPDGKKSIYNYQKGICREVIAELAGAKLRFVLREN
jgi:hypothetical protein